MKKMRTKVYIMTNLKNSEAIYSGIEFKEFIQFLSEPIENLMMITGGCNVISLETKFERGLELFEGHTLLKHLVTENIYALGNFCFVDYIASHATEKLRDEQIAELLYLGHMFKPLKEPFFEPLQNRFAYLAHDDGFFCKLYYRNIEDFLDVLTGKIKLGFCKKLKNNVPRLSAELLSEMLRITERGMFIDFEEVRFCDEQAFVDVYCIGKLLDMDTIYNDSQELKDKASERYRLSLSNHKWALTYN